MVVPLSSSSSCFHSRSRSRSGPCPCFCFCLCFCFFSLLPWLALSASLNPPPPSTPPALKIGAMLCLDTAVGNLSQQTLRMAVDDVNNDPSILNGYNLTILTVDTNCNAFQGAAAATELLKEEVVAVVGPQSSQVAHFVAQMGGVVQVPFLSFAATDPSLSENQYRYLFRMCQSDALQMDAIAQVIGHYGWREVVAIFSDDEFGANGIAALDSALVSVGARIVAKQAVPLGTNKSGMGDILINLQVLQPRVYIVHMQQDAGTLLAEAKLLEMMTTGYAWITTDSLLTTTVLDLGTPIPENSPKSMEGLIATRIHVPNSERLTSFMLKWKVRMSVLADPSEIIYALYAYDSVRMIASVLDSYLRQGGTLDFQDVAIPPTKPGGTSDLAKLKVLKGGPQLRQQILNTTFVGLSGPIHMDIKGDLWASAVEIINIVQKSNRVIGYWSNQTGLSLTAPDNTTVHPVNVSEKVLLEAIWPGGGTQVPRGWVLPKNGKALMIGVPRKVGYEEFIGWTANESSASNFNGFCIDVFERALKYLPYAVPYKFVPFGGGTNTPVYDDLIEKLALKEFDGVVGDVTITTKRMEKVDFTQPYINSGLVVVVPYRNSKHNYAWAFLEPFTPAMWFSTGGFFVFTGIVVWMLEHKKNRDFRGRPKKQIVTILWFSFSTLFFSHREDTKSILGRCVIIIWLFVVLIITSSYTANLTSILTVQQLAPSIQGISSLQASNVPIGYQTGSFVRDYLIGLNIAKERLRSYNTIKEFAEALRLGPSRGGVAAIVEELPYVEVFLSSQCGFTIAGQEFTKGGWGFAFPKDSEIAVDMSTAILTLSENGELQKIRNVWLSGSDCNRDSSVVDSTQLGLSSFWGLFLVTGIASIMCLIIYIGRLLCQFTRGSNNSDDADGDRSLSSKSAKFIKSFASYVNESAMNDMGHEECEQGIGRKKRKRERKVSHKPDS